MNPQTGNNNNNAHLTMFRSASWEQEMAPEWITTNVVRQRYSITSRAQNDCHGRELTVQTDNLPFFTCTEPSPRTKQSLIKSSTDGWIDCQTRRLGVGRVSEAPNENLSISINPSTSSSSMESSDPSSLSKANGLIGIRPTTAINEEDGWFVFAIDNEQSSPPPIHILKFSSQDIKESDDDMSDVSLCIDDDY
jgi:hypothetical protein